MKNRADVYTIITEQILDMMKDGIVPWRKPWNTSGIVPQNFTTRKAYRGINPFILGLSRYASPYWVTYKQAQALGGNVRKGEKGTKIVFWKWLDKKDTMIDPDTGELLTSEKRVPMLRYYTVFNVQQCDLPKHTDAELIPGVKKQHHERIETAERIAAEMPNKPEIRQDGGAAFYRPSADTVTVPPIEMFNKPEEFYSTLFHELGHSTGHEKRLDRDTLKEIASFGDHAYSREELVAEFTASYLCSMADIERETLENSAAYLANWHERLKKNPRWLVIAAAQAQKAADFILNAEAAEQEQEEAA